MENKWHEFGLDNMVGDRANQGKAAWVYGTCCLGVAVGSLARISQKLKLVQTELTEIWRVAKYNWARMRKLIAGWKV